MENDYFLNFQEKKEVIQRLKSINFENLKISSHFYNQFDLPRHGVTLEKAKEIFLQFDKMSNIFTRWGIGGKRYSIIYRLNKKKGYYIIFLLDEKPIQLFDAYFYGGEVEKRLRKKYFGY